MRHIAVRRTALVLATAFVVCAGLFAWLTAGPGTPSVEAPAPAAPASREPATHAEGARLYETYCAGCHPVDSLRTEISAGRRRELDAFLRTHGESSDEEDRLILDYLAGGR